MSEFVHMERRGPVAVLSIDRPQAMNALNREIVSALLEGAKQAEADPEIRALLFYSEKNFSAGADIKDMAESDPAGIRDFSFTGAFNQIENLKIPTIAVMEGYALGGGMELALCCDLRFAGEGAKIGFPEIGLGVFPGAGGGPRLSRLIGPAAAKELIYTGERIDAKRALEMGIVNRVVSDGALFDEAMAFAEKLAQRPPLALAAVKQVIHFAMDEPDMEKATAYEAELFSELFATADQKEGMRAFIEKRKPEFKGK